MRINTFLFLVSTLIPALALAQTDNDSNPEPVISSPADAEITSTDTEQPAKDDIAPENQTAKDDIAPESQTAKDDIAPESQTADDNFSEIIQSDTLTPAPENDAPAPDHRITLAPFPPDYVMHGKIITSIGELECDLYAGNHPFTVLNFVALSRENYVWTDATGTKHTNAYYTNLPFGSRVKGAYVTSSIRPEGTDFVIPDERCKTHQPTAGAIIMLQNHPGRASAQFALLARDIIEFKNMYTVFGQCGPIETIDKLTREDATIERIEF